MNAKKIMGAVLVALLAAALFVGAGAAATDLENGGTYFVYEVVQDGTGSPAVTAAGTWTHANGVDTITFTPLPGGSEYALIGANIVEGTYTKGAGTSAVSITVKYPTASISAYGTANGINYPVTGGSYYDVDGITSTLTIGIADPAEITANGIVVIGADGVKRPFGLSTFSSALSGTDLEAIFPVEGTYKLQAYYDLIHTQGGSFAATTPFDIVNNGDQLLLGKDVFTITIVDGADPAITAAADTVVTSNTIDVTIAGLPGQTYILYAPGFEIPAQAGAAPLSGTDNKAVITMPNIGTVTVTLEAKTKTGDFTVTVNPSDGSGTVVKALGDEADVDIEIVGGTITAAADKDAYYIGNDVTITGTSNAGSTVYFYIAGTNKEFGVLTADNNAEVKNGNFEFEIDGSVFKDGYDAGTYTVYVATDKPADVNDVDDLNTYATVALVLKQPFISVTDAPSVAVKGSTYEVKGTAEAAKDVYAYIFGTNFFAAATSNASIPAYGKLTGDNFTVQVKKNTFTVKAEIPKGVYDMAAGQYFMVVQHPMYDEQFNIAPNETKIVLNSTGDATSTTPDEYNTLFDVTERQKANAAEALCQAIDTENIDDMYVKLSFVVAAAQSVINPFPTEIAQGEKLTISGSTNVGEGEVVTVELLSTAFAAVPKATVGSASFISLTTKTDENGNWEVTFDTSGLNVDEYTLSAAVAALGSSTTAKVKVVEAAPETPDTPDTPDVPDTPDTPDTPTEPETPGFGALAALAGLGAVAVLLLRRE